METIPKRKKTKNKSETLPEIQAAVDCGIDISMLAANLKLSYAERLLRHQTALNTAEGLLKAKLV